MWPKPAPKLTHGETAVVGNRLNRAAGVTNNWLRLLGTTANPYAPPLISSSLLYISNASTEIAYTGVTQNRRAYSPSKLRPLPKLITELMNGAPLIPWLLIKVRPIMPPTSFFSSWAAADAATRLTNSTAIQNRLPNISPPARWFINCYGGKT